MYSSVAELEQDRMSYYNLNEGQILALLYKTAQKLGWHAAPASEAGFIAYTPAPAPEEITLRINGQDVYAASRRLRLQLKVEPQKNSCLQIFFSETLVVQKESTPFELSQAFEAMKPGMVSPGISFIPQPPSTKQENLSEFLSVFIPRQDYYCTPLLIELNILVYLFFLFTGAYHKGVHLDELFLHGALINNKISHGEWWRLLTCCFMHINFTHLLVNMFALFYIGSLIEGHIGSTKLLLFYLTTGVIASLTSVWWHPHVFAVGASGAVFGMFGLGLALLIFSKGIDVRARPALLPSMLVLIFYSLLSGMKPGIDNAAHLGGLVSGFLIGALVALTEKDKLEN